MNKYVVDTNVLLRLLLEDIPSQSHQAEKLFQDAKKGKATIFIPQIVIFEINFGLTKFYQLKKEEIIDKIESLILTDYIQVESKEIFTHALKLYSDLNLSFVDCFLLAKARLEDATVFTFDKRLVKISS